MRIARLRIRHEDRSVCEVDYEAPYATITQARNEVDHHRRVRGGVRRADGFARSGKWVKTLVVEGRNV